MRKLLFILFNIAFVIHAQAQITVQIPDTFLVYQIPKSIKGVNLT